jgi:hypothetical protein
MRCDHAMLHPVVRATIYDCSQFESSFAFWFATTCSSEFTFGSCRLDCFDAYLGVLLRKDGSALRVQLVLTVQYDVLLVRSHSASYVQY